MTLKITIATDFLLAIVLSVLLQFIASLVSSNFSYKFQIPSFTSPLKHAIFLPINCRVIPLKVFFFCEHISRMWQIMGSNPDLFKTKDLVFVVSLLSTQHLGKRAKSDWLGIMMCPSGATCLSPDCCFSELAL